ncbi:hypothetical protein PAXRUDRAFT_158006 [Paxillus rubicundulus Ve08.2h10]|uniref:Unplaced genomic scaffold scaffold_1137, whole genome shotgun sequence n=1 Tax=Paxillus rubicundulus Ve08.2h10 TaxID=930991 RepID=A0A0D0D9Z7_9AGAM|nr:hypothetical protein PAXRUDRAFT_158006 [Paxillus rubicundulus Ve08.2h10]
MWHISPYWNHFELFATIPLKSFAATNKQCFDVTGVGEMVIDMPNRVDVSKLCLTKVLFSPEVSYALVSIRHLDELGHSVNFADGTCTIGDPADDVIGQIPRSTRGLYHIVHEPGDGSANVSVETITVMELHCQMGHITPLVA